MKNLLSTALVVSSLGLVGGSNSKILCHGFLPQNDLRIPVTRILEGGVTEAQYNTIMDKIEKYYSPIVAAKGAHFQVNRLWTDETVNSSAEQQGNEWIINMYGGLARYPIMTVDGETLVACHETGHHLGGAPKIQGWFGNDWASNEGEADYYAALDCMRFMFDPADNANYVATQPIDDTVRSTCTSTYSSTDEQNLCMREAMAGQNVSLIFQALKSEKTAPRFDTPDPTQVGQTNDDHPATQCRMDTYYQASLCVHDLGVAPSDTDFTVGSCVDYNKVGARPRCWFSPNGGDAGGGQPHWPPHVMY